MQKLIASIKDDIKVWGLDFDAQCQKMFPDRADLSSAEYILVLRSLRTISHHDYSFDSAIMAVKEMAKDERAASLQATMRAILDHMNQTGSHMNQSCSHMNQTGFSGNSADLPETLTGESTTSAEVNTPAVASSPVEPTTPPRNLEKELTAFLQGSEFVNWFSVGPPMRCCAYIIHKRRFDLMEVATPAHDYCHDKFVSAHLARHGDLDGLKWIHDNMSIAAKMWDADTIDEYATKNGHLHILKWLAQSNIPECSYWKKAIDGKYLYIVQWYFITAPATAHGLAPEMLEYAKEVHADTIIDWLVSMGVGMA